ncbi:hypothetical protein PG990_009050 [Apiospora arundinis]
MSSTQAPQAGVASNDARSNGSNKVADPAKYRLPARYRQGFTKEQLEEQRALALFSEAQMHTRAWNAEEKCRKLQEDLEKAIQIGNYNCDAFERADSRVAELEENNMRLYEENKQLNNDIYDMQIDNQEVYDDRCDAMDRLEEL